MPTETGDHDRVLDALSPGTVESRIADGETAARLARWWKGDPHRMRELRLALLREGTGTQLDRVDDDAVLRLLGARIDAGRMRLGEVPRERKHSGPVRAGSAGGDEAEEAPPPATARAPAKSWIAFQVVWDDSGEPLGNLRLCVRLPHGRERHHVASGDGRVHLDEVPTGTCDVRCELNSPSTANTVAFVSAAEGDHVAEAKPPSRERKGRQQIARVVEHEVAGGESLESLALDHDLTWQELARFNWETEDPQEINEHLRWDVGCTKKTADGSNYIFSDSDDPGIIRIPQPWLASNLATGKDYVIRVRPVARAPEWLFSI